MTTNVTTTATAWPTITPSDTAIISPRPAGLKIGGTGGNLVIEDEHGNIATFPVEAGQFVEMQPTRVRTATVATPIYALYNKPLP